MARDEKILAALPEVIFYDELIQNQSAEFDWPQFSEDTPSSLCYTSGTTGNPKGVLYSHRSTLSVISAGNLFPGLTQLVCVRYCDAVGQPMFHVNACGHPLCVCNGRQHDCVLPGPNLTAIAELSLIDDYKVTLALGVPTIWQGLLAAAKNAARLGKHEAQCRRRRGLPAIHHP